MIYTITFSPSVDLFLDSKNEFNLDGLTRYENFFLLAGGKGINASIILQRNNFANIALTFLNGQFEPLIKKQLISEDVELINFKSENHTRINLKYTDQKNNFEINGPKAQISQKEFRKLLTYLKDELKANDLVMIMGLSEFDYLEQIIKITKKAKAQFVLDIDDPCVLKLLKYKPYVFKPNQHEMEIILETKIKTETELILAGKSLLEKGVQNLIISCGSSGALLLNNKNVFKAKIKKLKVINSAGAGDSMLAGFCAHMIQSNNLINSFKFANAYGMATISNKWIGTREDIKKYLNFVNIEKIE